MVDPKEFEIVKIRLEKQEFIEKLLEFNANYINTLKSKGYYNDLISEIMGMKESTIRKTIEILGGINNGKE